MMRGWLVVILLGVATVVIKAAGPLLLGGRRMPSRVLAVLKLLAPALFAGLVVTQVFADGRELTLDARAGGLVAAVAGACLRARPVVVLVTAAAVTAALRFFFP